MVILMLAGIMAVLVYSAWVVQQYLAEILRINIRASDLNLEAMNHLRDHLTAIEHELKYIPKMRRPFEP